METDGGRALFVLSHMQSPSCWQDDVSFAMCHYFLAIISLLEKKVAVGLRKKSSMMRFLGQMANNTKKSSFKL